MESKKKNELGKQAFEGLKGKDEVGISEATDIDFVKEFNIEDIWTTGCALNTTGKIDN